MKSKKAKLRSEADNLWFRVNLKDKCEVCGEKAIQVHHFFYKSSYGHLRYDNDNAISLCQKCHFILHHQDPKIITDKIIEKRGKEWYNKLKEKAQEKHRSYQTTGYYYDIIEGLQEKLKENTPR